MNANQAKQIPLADVLERIGCNVKIREKGGTELAYLSPWRAESRASLYVNTVKNVWFDHSEDEGGNTLDFAIMYLEKTGKLSSVKAALNWLTDTMGYRSDTFSFFSSQQKAPLRFDEPSRDLKVLGIAPLRSGKIFQYLKERGISKNIAQEYLCLVQYQNIKKPRKGGYYGFGQRNIGGGYEVRAATDQKKFKSALITRDITVHFGRLGEGVCVFEGMLDHLSMLAILSNIRLNNDVIILNGASCYEKAKRYILEKGYSKIDLFLDNDDTGNKVTTKFIEAFGKHTVDHRYLYEGFKDLNEALQKGQPPQFRLNPKLEP